MGIYNMLKQLKHKLHTNYQADLPLYLQDAVNKMEITIGRLQQTTNLNLFKTDYLE